MKKKGFTAEQIIGKLREGEVLLSEGSTVNLPIRSHPKIACHVEQSFLVLVVDKFHLEGVDSNWSLAGKDQQ